MAGKVGLVLAEVCVRASCISQSQKVLCLQVITVSVVIKKSLKSTLQIIKKPKTKILLILNVARINQDTIMTPNKITWNIKSFFTIFKKLNKRKCKTFLQNENNFCFQTVFLECSRCCASSDDGTPQNMHRREKKKPKMRTAPCFGGFWLQISRCDKTEQAYNYYLGKLKNKTNIFTKSRITCGLVSCLPSNKLEVIS